MIVVYTQNHCPLCDALKDTLRSNNIEFEEESDVQKMIELGITRTPMIRVNDNSELLNYKGALQWIEETR